LITKVEGWVGGKIADERLGSLSKNLCCCKLTKKFNNTKKSIALPGLGLEKKIKKKRFETDAGI